MTDDSRSFLGWKMVGLGSLCYGLGISPMYYSWGFFLPEMRQEIALTETQSGLVFSVFSYLYHLLGPVVGYLMGRFGIRSVVATGSLIGAWGFWSMSRAETFLDCLFAYGVLGGFAIGLATILPAQTLASNWFVKRRARALALVLAGGAVVGFFTNRNFGPWVLENFDWRTGWQIIAGISAIVAFLALAIRGRPEDVGQRPDGDRPGDGGESDEDEESEGPAWTAPLAMRTYQFHVLVALSVAYGIPWGVINVYGRLHLEAFGFTTAVAGSILGVRVLVSLLGRLSGLIGDFLSPQRMLAMVLIVEGAGTIGFVFATTPLVAYLSVVLVGLGFGAAYVTIPVAYSAFYGRKAFGSTVGARFAITGLISPAAPAVAGAIADWTSSYSPAFFATGALCLVGALAAFVLPAPGAPRVATPTPSAA